MWGVSTANDGPVTEAPDEEFWRCMRVDVFGMFLCSKYGIPEIIKAGGGSVINMASNLALMGPRPVAIAIPPPRARSRR